jgi:hypothetical protein
MLHNYLRVMRKLIGAAQKNGAAHSHSHRHIASTVSGSMLIIQTHFLVQNAGPNFFLVICRTMQIDLV